MTKNLLLTLSLAILGAASTLSAQEVKMAEFNFRQPASITPAGHAPEVPETPTDRTSTFYKKNVNGVSFTSADITLCAHGGIVNSTTNLPTHEWVFRRGYNDDGTKRATTSPEKYEGTYYLSMCRTDPEESSEPNALLTLSAPDGYTITKIELLGQSAANSPQYMVAHDPAKGTLTWVASTLTATWLPAEGVSTNSVDLKVPQKRPDDVNISSQIIPVVRVYYTEPQEPEEEGIELPHIFKFASQADVDAFTVIDANEDGKTFYYKSSAAELPWANGPKDDWLITPALAMEGGKYYRIDVHCNGSTDGEMMEVFIGRSATVAAMTESVCDLAVPNAYTIYHIYYKAEVTGNHYLGIHGKMDNDAYSILKIKTIDISAAREGAVPGAVTDLRLLSDASGARRADIYFTAPAVDLAGSTLTDLSSVSVYWGTYEGNCTNLIKTLTDVTPGQELQCEFKPSGNGAKTIMVVGNNASGEGVAAFTVGYIGVNKPSNVTNVRLSETENPGEVLLTWDIPAKDRDGYDINPALITYQVVNDVDFTTYNDVATNSLTIQAVPAGEQRFLRYQVSAKTKSGTSIGYEPSNWCAAGTPIAAPVCENFVERGNLPLLEEQNGGRAKNFHEADLQGSNTPIAADGDKYYACFYSYSDATPTYTTGKIDLSGLDTPTLTVKALLMGYLTGGVAAYGGNTLSLQVKEVGNTTANQEGDGFETLLETILADLETQGWKRLQASLATYAGKTVQIRLVAHISDFPYENAISFLFADDLRIGNAPAGTDLAAVTLETPDYAEPHRSFPLIGQVENRGAEDVENIEVSLLHNGETLATQTVDALAAGEAARLLFNHSLDIFAEDLHSYTLSVAAAEGETDLTNNVTGAVDIRLHLPAHPAPQNLTAVVEDGNVVLEWEVPDASATAVTAVTQKFEMTTPWMHDNVAGWTFYDQDCGPIGLPTGLTLPNIDEGYSRFAFTVMNNEGFGDGSTLAHSGAQALCAFYNFDARADNNWAITPELSGRAQTVSLWATSVSSRYYERVEFLYSTVSRDPSTFVHVDPEGLTGNFLTVPGEWTQYDIPLPEGARFFAIRHVSNDGWVFLVDDVTYEPLTPGAGVDLAKYHVYRDGERLDETDSDTTSHIDEGVTKGIHTYSVSALYGTAESLPHQWIMVDVPEQSAVDAPASAAAILTVNAIDGALQIINPTQIPVSVYTLDGRCVASSLTVPAATLPLRPGVYLVAAATATFKVLVR